LISFGYSRTFTIDAADTQDGVADIVAKFSWGEQKKLVIGSSGTFKATITIDALFITDSSSPPEAPYFALLWELFIPEGAAPYNWRVNRDNTLWANESSPNNVCPVGYRVPTQGEEGTNKEWEVEVDSWHTDDAHDNTNATHALASTLKLSMPGYRDRFGDLRHMGIRGNYWSSSNNEIYSYKLYLVPIKTIGFSGDADATAGHYLVPIKTFDFLYRSTGFSARCIKD
jgi:hypothetical protein